MSRAEAIVLVEGESDRAAVLAAAHVLGITLDGVEVMALGGATNIASFVRQLAAEPHVATMLGLADEAEQGLFLRHLPADDVFACSIDLEEELIRALGVDAMIEFIEQQGELRPFLTLQKQPAQRDRSVEQHLHRFCGSRATRKIRYANAITAQLPADRLPPPLVALLDRL